MKIFFSRSEECGEVFGDNFEPFCLGKSDRNFATKNQPHSSLPEFQNFITLNFWDRSRARRVLRRVLMTAFEKVLRRVLRRCLAVGFRGRKGSEKGSQKGLSEKALRRRKHAFLEYDPVGVRPIKLPPDRSRCPGLQTLHVLNKREEVKSLKTFIA